MTFTFTVRWMDAETDLVDEVTTMDADIDEQMFRLPAIWLKSAVANALDAYFCHREHHRTQNARVDFAGNESIKQAFFLTGQPTITYAALA